MNAPATERPFIEVDPQSGFCFGVVYAIEMAEEFLDDTGSLYCLGDIVHNDLEVARLEAKGLQIINHDQLEQLHNTTVLIRAHGEPPSTYETALRNNLTLVDASCPVVLKLQHRVRKAYEDREPQVVIYGKPGHAEVNGLVGQTHGEALVITGPDDLDRLDLSRPIQFFSQTTKSTASFYALKQQLLDRGATLVANDTICRQVSNREPQLAAFAAQYDVVVFVAGHKSSNGKVLFEVCRNVNPRTHFVSGPAELEDAWFAGAARIGICGATSTPQWLMDDVQRVLQERLAAP